MSRTFLALCQDVVSDLGVAGGILQSTASGINQEQQRVCNWVARADLLIQLMWADWNFLWTYQTNVQAQTGARQLVLPIPTWSSGISSVDENTLWYMPGTTSAQPVPWVDWDEFYRSFMQNPPNSTPCPSMFSIDPQMNLWFSDTLEANASFGVEYACLGKRMATDTAVSPIPNAFDDIIVERAKILYAQRENAPEILTGSSAEFADLLEKMQAFCLPRNRAGRTLRNNAATVRDAYVE